jgi:pimeloyl-ACP methyl ester carboxylesterase
LRTVRVTALRLVNQRNLTGCRSSEIFEPHQLDGGLTAAGLGCVSLLGVDTKWEIFESDPGSAEQTVLLLPGGMCSARSYAEVMAEPTLAGTRMLAVTMPGHAGAPPPRDFSTEAYARITAELAKSAGVDLVVGFSMGATVAYEMVVSGAFAGPVVLLGVSLSAADEPRFFRAIIRLGSFLGTLPFAVLKKGAASIVKHAAVPPERQAELRADFARNNTHDMRRGLRAYLRWLRRDDDPARRLCETDVPGWVVHAEKGDGALTQHERAVLESCPHVRVVTIPGQVFLLPNEVPQPIADVIVQALEEAGASTE